MIYADSLFEIGKSHSICEDYSTQKIEKEFGVIVVSDGCSGSSQTDIGSRVLSLVAEKYISQNYETILTIDPNTLGQIIIHEAHSAIRVLELSEEVLDATLLICFFYQDKYRIIKFGDGVSMVGNKSGDTYINYSNYDEEHVYYLNYIYNNKRNENYKKSTSKNKKDFFIKYTNESGAIEKKESESFSTSFVTETGDVNNLDYIILATDGLFTCSKNSDVSDDMFFKFLNIKSLKGVFLERRYKAWKKMLFKNGLNHTDDVGLAGFSFIDYKGNENDS